MPMTTSRSRHTRAQNTLTKRFETVQTSRAVSGDATGTQFHDPQAAMFHMAQGHLHTHYRRGRASGPETKLFRVIATRYDKSDDK